MPSAKTFLLTTLGFAGILSGAVAMRQQAESTRPAPQAPSGVELLQAHAFQLDQAFTFTWRKEQPQVSSGYLLVLRADAEVARRRQTFESVLYAGGEVAERINNPGPSGHIVALVPAPLDAAGQVDFDPRNEAMWFGRPELPERIDAQRIAEETQLALSLGLGLPDVSRLDARSLQAEEAIHAVDRDELDFFIADLIETYSPDETELVELLRMPRSN